MSVSIKFYPKKFTVVFYIKKEAAQDAEKIELICEHNGWEPVALKPQKNGTFRGSITIPRGIKNSYQYKFKYYMKDGSTKYDNDWNAQAYIESPFGGDNSVFYATEQKKETV